MAAAASGGGRPSRALRSSGNYLVRTVTAARQQRLARQGVFRRERTAQRTARTSAQSKFNAHARASAELIE